MFEFPELSNHLQPALLVFMSNLLVKCARYGTHGSLLQCKKVRQGGKTDGDVMWEVSSSLLSVRLRIHRSENTSTFKLFVF